MVEDKFVSGFPSNQNGIDCFKDIWYSRFPGEYQVSAGECSLYEDPRMEWALQQLEPTNLWDVLELGPLEAGHSYYMEKHSPVRSITAIEANRICWVKCLIAKEIVDLKRSRFLLGNFLEYLRKTNQSYDLCLALGVLYHMKNPLELIQLLAKSSDRIILWTQLANSKQQNEWKAVELNDGDLNITGYLNDYGKGGDLGKFIGGIENYAIWMTKEKLLEALHYYGFRNITLGAEGENQFGDQITLVATKA